MKLILLILSSALLHSMAFAIDYGDDGQGDNRFVGQERCSGVDTSGRPLIGSLQREYWGGQPTHSWRWQVTVGNDRWYISSYPQPYGAMTQSLTVFYPSKYNQPGGRPFSFTGNSKFVAQRTVQNVRLFGSVTSNLADRPLPAQFDFRMVCRPIW